MPNPSGRPRCKFGASCPLDSTHRAEMYHPPVQHRRTIHLEHGDDTRCRGSHYCGNNEHTLYGACICTPAIQSAVGLDAQMSQFIADHPNDAEREAATRRAWAAAPPDALDDYAWIRARAGLNESMRLAAQAWDACEDPDDPEVNNTKAFMSGYITALAAVRGLDYSSTGGALWCMTPAAGTFGDWLRDSMTKAPDPAA